MTRYIGFQNGDAFVLSDDPYTLSTLVDDGVAIAWGDQSPASATLAKAILTHALNDAAKAVRLHRRYLHRVVSTLPKGESWSLSRDDVMNVVSQMDEVERDMAGERAAMAREVPKVLDGRLARDQKWTSNPDITRNDPDKARRNRR